MARGWADWRIFWSMEKLHKSSSKIRCDFSPGIESCKTRDIWSPTQATVPKNGLILAFVSWNVYKGIQCPKPLVFSTPSLFPLLLGFAGALLPPAKRLVPRDILFGARDIFGKSVRYVKKMPVKFFVEIYLAVLNFLKFPKFQTPLWYIDFFVFL